MMIKNILNSCPTQGWIEGWDAMNSLYWRSVNNKDTCLTHRHRDGWNEWEKWWSEVCCEENWRNPKRNLHRPHFVHHETHMEWPRHTLWSLVVGGENCATVSPLKFSVNYNLITENYYYTFFKTLKKCTKDDADMV